MQVSTRATLIALALVSIGLSSPRADIILPTDPAGINTYTTADGLVTLNAYATVDPLVEGVFSPDFIGVLGGNNGVNDDDGDPATGNDREAIDIILDPTVGLIQIQFQWTRADGPLPTDGVQISGFVADPGVALSGGSGTATASFDAGLGSIFINHPWDGGNITTVDFSNLAASAGQTLRIGTNDSTETGPQAPMTSISYAIIPEPSTLALLGIGAGLMRIRRRRR
jgi:hypothetical protein